MEGGPEYKNLIEDLGFGRKKEGQKRPEMSQKELAREIALIARIFSRQYGMDVLPSDAWACGLSEKANETIKKYLTGEVTDIRSLPADIFKPKVITYDQGSLAQESRDEVIGKIRHEVGHAKHSDYRLLIEGMKTAKDEGYLPTSWINIANAIEDPWVNNLESRDSETVRQKITALYENWKKDTVEYIGSQPVTRQLGLNIIYYWLTGQNVPTLKNEEVKKVFNDIEPHLNELFEGESPEKNFELIKNQVWQKYRILEEKAVSDEEMKKMMESAAKDLVDQLRKQGDKGENKEDKGILSKLKEKFSGKKKGRGKGGKTADAENLSQNMDAETKEQIRDELGKQIAREKKREEGRKSSKKTGDISSGVKNDINLDELPQELKEKLKDIISRLPQDVKKRLAEEARRELDRKQAESLNKELPSFIKLKKDKETGEFKPEFETKSDDELKDAKNEVEKSVKEMRQKEAEELEKEVRALEERLKREKEEAEKKRQEKEMADYGFSPEEKEQYNKFRELEDSMRSQIENFLKILDRYLPKKEEYAYSGEYFTGKKADFSKLAQKIPIKRYDIFKRREIQESSEPKLYVTLIIDNSGSMRGQKMEESLKTAVFFARVLKRFGIPFSIKFFGERVVNVKEFDDDYDDRSKRIKPNLVMLADASGGSTDISEPLEATEKEMAEAKRKFTGSQGAMFIISDGGANNGRVGQDLRKYIEELQKTYIVNGFGLGTGAAQELKGYFGENNTAAVNDFSELPQEAFKILRVTLERVLKRLRKI